MGQDYGKKMGKPAKYADGGEVKSESPVSPQSWDRISAPTLGSADSSTGFAGGLATGMSNGRALKDYKDQIDARKPAKMADGGEVKDKEAGLKASSGEKVGLLARLRMGNIDDSSSEAYKRFGAGRGKAERDLDSATKEADNLRSVSASKAAEKSMKDDADFDAADASFKTARAVSGSPSTAPTPKPAKAAAPKAAPKPAVDMRAGRGTNRAAGTNTLPASAPKPAAPAPAAAPAAAAGAAAAAAAGATRAATAYNPGYLAQLDRDEKKREERRAQARQRDVDAASEWNKQAEALKNDPAQQKIRAEREAWDAKSPAEKSAARGQAIKSFFGMANGGMVGGPKSYGKKC
jgi:hypothetical protein